MNRKILIAGAVIILIIIGVIVYFIFFTSSAGITVAPTGGVGFPTAGQGTSSGIPGTGKTTSSSSKSNSTTGTPKIISPRLVKISEGPVASGEVVIDTPATKMSSSSPAVAGETVVNYIERQSGNVFTYKTHAGVITRTNNQTVPGIESASWLPNASFAFVRYLSGDDFSTINTYALPGSGAGGFFLPQNLSDIAVSSTSLLVLASGVNGSIASLEHLDGTHISQLFTSPLTSLRISFAGKSQYLAFTKPSATLSGDAFLVGSTGHFFRVAGPLNGLVALASPTGKWLLVSYTSDANAMQMELVNTVTGDTIPLPVGTIADKCVWTADEATIYCGVPVSPSSDNVYPDDWYQGVVHFSDRIWKIDVSGRYAQLVLDFPSETKDVLDAESLSVNPSNTELIFVNKNDGSLWGYQL